MVRVIVIDDDSDDDPGGDVCAPVVFAMGESNEGAKGGPAVAEQESPAVPELKGAMEDKTAGVEEPVAAQEPEAMVGKTAVAEEPEAQAAATGETVDPVEAAEKPEAMKDKTADAVNEATAVETAEELSDGSDRSPILPPAPYPRRRALPSLPPSSPRNESTVSTAPAPPQRPPRPPRPPKAAAQRQKKKPTNNMMTTDSSWATQEEVQSEDTSNALATYEDELVVRLLESAAEDIETEAPRSLRSLLESCRDVVEPRIPRPPPLRPNRSLREVRMSHSTHFVDIGDDGGRLIPARWPNNVVQLGDHYNPDDLRFQDVIPDRMCGCPHPCRVDSCDNARFYIFCDVMCCPYAGICGNGLEPSRHLQLMRRAMTRELTVVATNTIDKGVVIGEYLGRMKAERFTARERPANSGYRMYMHHDPEHPSNQRVCIDAIRFGSLLRYVNHACFANVRFRQVCNRDQHTIVAVTNRRIMPGEEIFANYGDELWFLCRCENINCAHRALIMQNKAKAAREKEKLAKKKLAKGKLPQERPATEKGKMKRPRTEFVNDKGFVGKGKKKRVRSASADDEDSGEEEERYEESDDFED